MRRQDTPPKDSHAGVDAAWRIHQAQVDWTGKVDGKAAFAFGLESAAITTVLALTSSGRTFARLHSWQQIATYAAGLTLLITAAVFALLVVAPRLRGRRARAEAKTNYIYFGHARHWTPERLQAVLREDDLLPQLSRQIVNMANIAWMKHRHVQWSMWLAVGGGILIVVCSLLVHFPPT